MSSTSLKETLIDWLDDSLDRNEYNQKNPKAVFTWME